MPNITTNNAITYTNRKGYLLQLLWQGDPKNPYNFVLQETITLSPKL